MWPGLLYRKDPSMWQTVQLYSRFLLVALVIALVGCSADNHAFMSTPSMPITVTVVDVHSDQILWEKDIPVYCRLVLDFDAPREVEGIQISEFPATHMDWWLKRPKDFPPTIDALVPADPLHILDPRNLWTAGTLFVPDDWVTAHKGRVSLPGRDVTMKVSFRPSPEYPPSVWPELAEPRVAGGAEVQADVGETTEGGDESSQPSESTESEATTDEATAEE